MCGSGRPPGLLGRPQGHESLDEVGHLGRLDPHTGGLREPPEGPICGPSGRCRRVRPPGVALQPGPAGGQAGHRSHAGELEGRRERRARPRDTPAGQGGPDQRVRQGGDGQQADQREHRLDDPRHEPAGDDRHAGDVGAEQDADRSPGDQVQLAPDVRHVGVGVEHRPLGAGIDRGRRAQLLHLGGQPSRLGHRARRRVGESPDHVGVGAVRAVRQAEPPLGQLRLGDGKPLCGQLDVAAGVGPLPPPGQLARRLGRAQHCARGVVGRRRHQRQPGRRLAG